MKYAVSISLIFVLIFQPLTVAAQSASCNSISGSNYDECCTNPETVDDLDMCQEFYDIKINPTTPIQPAVPQSNAMAQYNPSISIGSSNGSFSGVKFSGVGSAVLGCSGADTLLTNAIGSAKKAVTGLLKTGLSKIFPGSGFITDLFGGGTQEVKDTGLQNKESCLDKLAYVLAQQALSQMTTKTLNWVNAGFDGNPLYIRDVDSYLQSVENQTLAKYFNQVQTSDPIFGNALRSVIKQQVTGKADGLLNKALKTPEAVAYGNFMDDFTNGGWNALLNSSNNPLSALFSATNTLGGILGTQEQNTREELTRNGGFLDMKTCVEYANQGQVGSGNGDGLSNTPVCLKYATTTPGSIISQQVSTVTGSPIRQAELADELNEAIGTFFDSLLNKLFSKNNGLASLKGGTLSGLGGTSAGQNVVFDSNGNPYSDQRAFDQPEFAMGFAQDFDISRPQQIRAILQAQYNFLNRSRDVAVAATNFIPTLAHLDYCIPGPNPSWEEGIQNNLESMFSTLRFEKDHPMDSGNVAITPFAVIDRLTGTTKAVTARSGEFETHRANITTVYVGQEYNFGVGSKSIEPTPAEAQDFFRRALDEISTELNTTYNQTTVPAAFAATASNPIDQAFSRGVATTAYRAADTLVPYVRSVGELINTYSQTDIEVQANIAELEAINNEVQEIVRVAKARYIAQRASAGNPVNMECIDQAYVVNQSTVTGPARLESDADNPAVVQMEAANNYFNSTL